MKHEGSQRYHSSDDAEVYDESIKRTKCRGSDSETKNLPSEGYQSDRFKTEHMSRETNLASFGKHVGVKQLIHKPTNHRNFGERGGVREG